MHQQNNSMAAFQAQGLLYAQSQNGSLLGGLGQALGAQYYSPTFTESLAASQAIANHSIQPLKYTHAIIDQMEIDVKAWLKDWDK